MHEVLQNHLEAIKTGTAPLNYEVNSWQDLERRFVNQIALQRRYNMTRGAHSEQFATKLPRLMNWSARNLSLIFEIVKNKLVS